MPSPPQVAFSTAVPLSVSVATRPHLLSQHVSRVRTRRVRRVINTLAESSPQQPSPATDGAPQKARLHSTGETIYLSRAAPSSPSAAVYLQCPACRAAYLGNAIRRPMSLTCASCGHTFSASPADLMTATDPPAPPPVTIPVNSISCVHARTCSGCSLFESVDRPPLLEQARSFFSSVPSTVQAGPAHAWRTHAKLAVRRPKGKGYKSRVAVGLFRRGSHDVAPIPGCAVHSPAVERAAALVVAVLNDARSLTPYDEYSGSGDVRYLVLTEHRATSRVQLTLVWNSTCWKDASGKVQLLSNELWHRSGGNLGKNGTGSDVLHSIWCNWNTSRNNTILNPERDHFYHVCGDPILVEKVRGVPFSFPPYVFRQSNLDAFEDLVLPKLLSYIPKRSRVAELCAGVGVIGISALRERNLEVLWSSEIHDGARTEFWKTIRSLRRSKEIPENASVDFFTGSDEDTIAGMVAASSANVLIVDPPRSGLSKSVVERLATLDFSGVNYEEERLQSLGFPAELNLTNVELQRILYLSCGFDALKRDVKMICAHKKWAVSAVHYYVLFPGSDHIETLAVFDKVDTKRRRDHTPSARRATAYRNKAK